jgi:hypothetical protein
MGVLFGYFAAASDETAASAINVDGGPASAWPHPFETVALKGIDPVVQMGTLEALLTEVDYETVANNPRSGHSVAIRDEGERIILTITDELQAALAGADAALLREVAVPWSQTDEFEPGADPADLAGVLGELASLVQGATVRGERLYCWVCV